MQSIEQRVDIIFRENQHTVWSGSRFVVSGSDTVRLTRTELTNYMLIGEANAFNAGAEWARKQPVDSAP